MNIINNILNLILEKRSLDFSGYRTSMLERRFRNRLSATHSTNFKEYKKYLENNNEELEKLIDALTINVSQFFRDS